MNIAKKRTNNPGAESLHIAFFVKPDDIRGLGEKD